ncbi:hypothetical protein [Butyrivibrio proteoclasticus]|uniref:hypothetical protein n=1 Tax=Butyrivibrio proteoclasticus TaxID=43305 RepID=UPI0002E379C8|nr:hypothetical protein [Butyrivibrio proteoclasticus]
MLFNYEIVDIGGCRYQVGVGVIINTKTQVSFLKPGTTYFANICIENNEVVANTGLRDDEIFSI